MELIKYRDIPNEIERVKKERNSCNSSKHKRDLKKYIDKLYKLKRDYERLSLKNG